MTKHYLRRKLRWLFATIAWQALIAGILSLAASDLAPELRPVFRWLFIPLMTALLLIRLRILHHITVEETAYHDGLKENE